MSKAVSSDGSIQKMFDVFIADFETLSNEKVNKAVAWFSALKENGRERLDDVTLPSLYRIGAKFYDRYGNKATNNPPAIIKKYTSIKLLQGKATWDLNAPTHSTKGIPWD